MTARVVRSRISKYRHRAGASPPNNCRHVRGWRITLEEETMRLRVLAAAAAIAALSLAPAAAQDKKVRFQMAGAYPSATAILGTGQLYTVDKIKKLSAGSIDIRF